jgi:hypothetical protein
VQPLERWQHRAQCAQQRQIVRGEALVAPVDPLRLAQLLAALHPQLAAQRCGSLVLGPQLLLQRLRRRPQLVVDAAQGHGEARIKHVAQLDEDDALLVTAQLRQRHRGAARRGARGAERRRASQLAPSHLSMCQPGLLIFPAPRKTIFTFA